MNDKVTILDCGDSALSLRFGEEISPEVHARVMRAQKQIEELRLPGLKETVASYCALLLSFDPLVTDGSALRRSLTPLLEKGFEGGAAEEEGRLVRIPVCYGGAFGEDLGFVARHAGMTEEEVIALHSGTIYPVYMIGFTAGFPYLGGLDPRLETPRLETPRTLVPAGSVGIAGMQTGVYSVASPGGWQLIGRTPLKIYDPRRSEPFLLKAGDRLKFDPISPEEFAQLEKGGTL